MKLMAILGVLLLLAGCDGRTCVRSEPITTLTPFPMSDGNVILLPIVYQTCVEWATEAAQ